jgi:peptidoglycan/xylan/chitin deacetylase (PgdA/CDA1 family)
MESGGEEIFYAPDLLPPGAGTVGNGRSAAAGPLRALRGGLDRLSARVRRAAARPDLWSSRGVVTERLPILMYHRVARSGSPLLERFRVSPEQFEEQLRFLRNAGFRSATLAEWGEAMRHRRPLPGRRIMLTFDDGYQDFADHAWPLLQRYGFRAVVFLVTDEVGGENRWDAAFGETAPLLGWTEIRRLQAEGAEFGSHTATHPQLCSLSAEEVVREAARSRAVLRRQLGTDVTALAYPYGDQDPIVQHLVGACGYTYGLTTNWGPSDLADDPLALPRLEVEGLDSLDRFVEKIDGVLLPGEPALTEED